MTAPTIAMSLLTTALTSQHALALTAGTDTHEPALRLTGQLVRHGADAAWITAVVRALLPEDYAGNTLDELPDMIESAIKKGFGKEDAGVDAKAGPKASESLLSLVQTTGAALFHNEQGEAFIAAKGRRGTRAYPVNSEMTRSSLRLAYYRAKGKPITETSLTEVIDTLTAIALHDGPQQKVHLRIGGAGGCVYIDLGDDTGEFVCISPDGWTMVGDAPPELRFYRSSGMLPLPRPERGGDLQELRALLALENDNWLLLLAFLLNCLKPDGPYMFLLVDGEQGSGKSLLCAIVKGLLDPNAAEKLRLPKNEHDLMIQATENALLVFDNASGVKWDISDALCSLATGGGFTTRKYYTDNEARTFKVCRPVIINGIGEFASRPDLLERSMQLHLPSMPATVRKTERELKAELERITPGVLGALLDIIGGALQDFDQIEPPTSLRMADAAHWLAASERAAGLSPGTFVKALEAVQADMMMETAMHDPLVMDIAEMLHQFGAKDPAMRRFDGTVGELYLQLEMRQADRPRDRYFPPTPQHLSNHLKRQAPAMDRIGIRLEFGAKTRRGKAVHIWVEGGDMPLTDPNKTPPPAY